jgi:Uncharacterized protein conserved in bacteria (DUF2188)
MKVPHRERVSWFLRVVEMGENQWQCRWGEQTYDEHTTMMAALAHLRVLAREHQPATLFVHRLDGTFERLDDLPTT